MKQPTGKTGVAFGLLRCRESGRIEVSDIQPDEETGESFQLYIGRQKKGKFKTLIDRSTKMNVWYEFLDDASASFDILYTDVPEAATNNAPITISKQYPVRLEQTDADAQIYIRPVASHAIEYAVALSRDDLESNNFIIEPTRIDLATIESQRDKLQADLENLRNEKATIESQRDKLQADLENLRAEKATVESQRDDLQADLNNLRNEKASVEGQLATVRREKASVERQRDKLQVDLAERFADGWELYQKFLSLEASARKDSGLYAENFEAFICSGAQMKRLEGIWESALDSKRAGKIACAEIFWEVFAYCVRLVNAAQGDNIIEILNTQIGERYDTDKHSTSGTNSSTQGVVREIILTGYRNNISRKIVRKSNVRVG